ncbi:hypothetical protein [Paraburkholderia rhizosphaerae]|uniref:hypothetical protein n=1 Tax=Paraburkholderia rhizosphaerae TaxID=480658 RepID=UPI0010653A35|nr:hypothetical protein [Paraburkholderia rhizosphaerae]
MRNSLAVVVPTTLRQLLSYGIENALTDAGANNNTRTAIATLTTLLPVMLLMMGLARDKMHGTETAASQRSRLIMAGGALLATVLGIAFGQMAPSASQILAFTCYTFMRDIVVQSRLRLNNLNAGDNPPSKLHFALISLVYGIDQFLVNLGMSKLASPSGPSAFIAGAGIQGSHALIRGGLNGAGESVEDVAFGGIGAALDRKTLQLRTTDAGYQRHNVINGALGPFPVRSAFLDMSIIGSNIISQYVRDPTKQEYLNNLYFFALTAILYEPFANASSGQPQPPATQDPDTGSQHGSDVVYTSHNQNWTRPNSTRSMALSDLREGERPGSRGASIEDAPIDDAPPVDSASVGAANSGNVHDTEAGTEFVDPQYLPSQDPPALPPSPRPSISRNSIKTSSSSKSAEDSGTPPA